nr:hypothetical protein [Corynebacterium lactis]
MADHLIELEKLANDPRYSGTNARSLFDCAEYGIAASELIEEIHNQKASISASEKEALLEYLQEYGMRDQDVYDAYADLLR